MTITPVDSELNLFLIEDIYPEFLLNKMPVDVALYADWRREDMQSDWQRRRLNDSELTKEFDSYVKTLITEIQQATGYSACACDTGFWLDEPGFTVDRHLDNSAVTASMQIYLWDNPLLPGTAFYHNNEIRKEFAYKKNSGYFMINGPDQYHGMTTTVPPGQYRLCSYTWFYPKVYIYYYYQY